MKKSLEQNLLTFRRRTITIDELEQLSRKANSYESFAANILALEEDNILEMVKSKGRTLRTPSLAYHYRINKHQLNRTYYQQLQVYRMKFHNAINLDAYFKLDPAIWAEDLLYLEKINTYIEKRGFPTEKVSAPERSFELVGDEKWIEEQKGSEVLHRINVWDQMNIFPVSDPLMFAINPANTTEKTQLHLIVENKATYQALLPVITETIFSTLIYGAGNKIPKSIENFQDQYPVKGKHIFFYFGDIDRSGITIWHSLYLRESAIPALPFYEVCFGKKYAFGKTNQRRDEDAITAFLNFFPETIQEKIHSLLDKGAYYPQEVLNANELQAIWKNTDWLDLIREESLHGID